METTRESQNYSFGLLLEQYGPAVCGAVTLTCLLYFSEEVAQKFVTDGWKSAGLYAAIFDWSAIQTGFSFGVYGFVLGRGGGFIEKIKDTKAMSRFLSYIKRANIAGFMLTISSIPLIITEPSVSAPLNWIYGIIAVWFSLFVWSFLSFLRIAYNFGQIASVKDKAFHGA